MGFRCQMHDGIRLIVTKNPPDVSCITDIHLLKIVVGFPHNSGQRFQVTCIGEFVDIDDPNTTLAHQVPYQGRTNETRPTGNQNRTQAQRLFTLLSRVFTTEVR